ncbi:Lrp/AsnC family transcriptional regulator [Salinibaculum rarum]|uniref:Lrp/AsnC family transcriptional regulator n=1 Tax=Salinibaculum rarum TaxID=3058903 RepID=UPI00265FF2C8|nr:winged helix-turn-helix domain-containing protein [Salinibaculum sp. KK48]
MDDAPDWEFSERDICILKELSRDPQLSSRKLADRLAEEYDIDVSHVTVSESVRKMREEGVFRDAILINEAYFNFTLMEFKFDTSEYADRWREAMEYIRDDEHTLFYSLSTGTYQWKTIMMFPGREAESRWVHEFYKEHGDAIDNLRNHALHNVLKFRTDPGLLDTLKTE